MSKLTEGTRVKTTTDLIGTVEAIYDMGSVVYYIVKLGDGSLYKFFEDQLTEVEEEPAPEEEPTESDTITITRDEFREKISDVIADILTTAFIKGDWGLYTALTRISPVICANTENALFGEPKENV